MFTLVLSRLLGKHVCSIVQVGSKGGLLARGSQVSRFVSRLRRTAILDNLVRLHCATGGLAFLVVFGIVNIDR